jgi:hypothetical protein
LSLAPWPFGVMAQQRIPVVGILGTNTPETNIHLTPAFGQVLKEEGFVAGQNAAFEHRFASGRLDRLPGQPSCRTRSSNLAQSAPYLRDGALAHIVLRSAEGFAASGNAPRARWREVIS